MASSLPLLLFSRAWVSPVYSFRQIVIVTAITVVITISAIGYALGSISPLLGILADRLWVR